ncbi:MAG: S8 family serine peptidase [Aureispira sp.]
MSAAHYIQKIWSDISKLQQQTKGKGVKVAILDGSIDTSHPCFVGSNISFTNNMPSSDMATTHGTHVASIMLSNEVEELKGICPEVECISIPIFRAREDGNIIPSSQLELARSIETALNSGVDIINISAGEKVLSAEPQQRLQRIIERCVEEGVLLISAVGNDGCPCIHVPAIHPNILAVGALDMEGVPTSFSNWGKPYQFNGIMAPGEAIKGANPEGGYSERSGTSFATPIVSGVVALIYSYLKHTLLLPITPLSIRAAILNNSFGCPIDSSRDKAACDRFLHGILNISGAVQYLEENTKPVKTLQPSFSENRLLQKNNSSTTSTIHLIPQYTQQVESARWMLPSSYNGKKEINFPLVFAIGSLTVDYETDALLDSFKFYMQELFQQENINISHPDPYNPHHLTTYLKGKKGEDNLYDAARVTWIVKINEVPVYAIKPSGPFSKQAYALLVQFLQTVIDLKEEFLDKGIKYRINLCSIPGHIVGKTKIRSGAILPIIRPNIRAMYNWVVKDLVEYVTCLIEENGQNVSGMDLFNRINRLSARLTFQLEHLGLSSTERALNYVVTNLFNLGSAFVDKLAEGYELNDIKIEKSLLCRPDSDCQDVIIVFFKPYKRLTASKHIFRFTIDVSEVIPIAVGEIREWFEY